MKRFLILLIAVLSVPILGVSDDQLAVHSSLSSTVGLKASHYQFSYYSPMMDTLLSDRVSLGMHTSVWGMDLNGLSTVYNTLVSQTGFSDPIDFQNLQAFGDTRYLVDYVNGNGEFAVMDTLGYSESVRFQSNPLDCYSSLIGYYHFAKPDLDSSLVFSSLGLSDARGSFKWGFLGRFVSYVKDSQRDEHPYALFFKEH